MKKNEEYCITIRKLIETLRELVDEKNVVFKDSHIKTHAIESIIIALDDLTVYLFKQ